MSDGSLEFSDVLRDEGRETTITVTTTPQLVQVGPGQLIGRELLYVENLSDDEDDVLLYGPTTSPKATLFGGEFVFLPLGEQVPIYIAAQSGSFNVTIQEFG